MVRGRGLPLAQTVMILNLGTAIETADSLRMRDIYSYAAGQSTSTNPYAYSNQGIASRAFAASSNGTVLFSNNICQLEARADASVPSLHRDPIAGSLTIPATILDRHRQPSTPIFDAILRSASVNVTSNRFQESPISMLASGLTAGIVNVTSQKYLDFCLLVKGAPSFTIDQSNLALINLTQPGFCDSLKGQ